MSAQTSGAVAAFPLDWAAVARHLGPRFAERAALFDETDTFVHQNFADLRTYRVLAAAVPAELGGGGATVEQLAAMLRTLARACGSTAMALALHTAQVAALAWRWRHEGAAAERLLRRVAAEQIVLVGGIEGPTAAGAAERAEGGWRVTLGTEFAANAPVGNLLLASAVAEDEGGPTVLHFEVPFGVDGPVMNGTWRALGLRGTGAHDLRLDEVFVPESAVTLSRPQGCWHPALHVSVKVALPLVLAVHVGLAEAARDNAVALAVVRPTRPPLTAVIGEMETELMLARLALDRMVTAAASGTPGPATTNEVLMARALAGRAVLRIVELAMEAVGAAAFHRGAGLERLFRDVQALRFHPFTETAARDHAGRFALGLDVEDQPPSRPGGAA